MNNKNCKNSIMKKLLIAIIFFFSVSCYSQTVYFNGGISHSKLDFTYKASYYPYDEEKQYKDALIGSSFFIGEEYLKHKIFSLSTEIGIYRAGGEYSSEELNKQLMFDFLPPVLKFEYFSINTCVNFSTLDEKLKLQFQVGPKLDFIIKKNDSFFSDKGLYRNNVFGFIAGLGIYYKFNKIQLGINGKYIIGKQKISQWSPPYYQSPILCGIKSFHSTYF